MPHEFASSNLNRFGIEIFPCADVTGVCKDPFELFVSLNEFRHGLGNRGSTLTILGKFGESEPGGDRG